MREYDSALLNASRSGDIAAAQKALVADADVSVEENDGWTPLHIAALNGHTDVVKTLLAAGANVNVAKTNGVTSLHVAARNGHMDIVKTLLTANAEVNTTTNHGSSALMTVARYGHLAIVEIMLAAGARINIVDRNGDSALICTALGSHEDIARVLVQARADPSIRNIDKLTAAAIFEHDGKSAIARLLRDHEASPATFFCAVTRGVVDVVRQLVNAAVVSARGDHDRTPLHQVAQCGHIDVIPVLIAEGADLEARDASGSTPLHVACATGNTAAVRVLVEQGANAKALDDQGLSCVAVAAMNGHLDVMIALVEQGMSLSNATKDGQSVLHLGVQSRNPSLVKNLLRQAPALAHAVDGCGSSVLHYAVRDHLSKAEDDDAPMREEDRIAVLRMLLAVDGMDVNMQNNNGESALLTACERGDTEVIQLLLAHGAKINHADKTGRTPLSVAVSPAIQSTLQVYHRSQHFHDRCFDLINNRATHPAAHQLTALVPLVTSVSDLRWMLTLVALSDDDSRSLSAVLKSAFDHVIKQNLTFDDHACVFFQLVLERCERDNHISRADLLLFSRKAEKIHTDTAESVINKTKQADVTNWLLNTQQERLRSVVDGVNHAHTMVMESRATVPTATHRVDELRAHVVACRKRLGELTASRTHVSAQMNDFSTRLIQAKETVNRFITQLTSNVRDVQTQTNSIRSVMAMVVGFVIGPVLEASALAAIVEFTDAAAIVSTLYGERNLATFLTEQSNKTLLEVVKHQLEKCAIPVDAFETLVRELAALLHPELVAECELRGFELKVDGGRSDLVTNVLNPLLDAEEATVVALQHDLNTARRDSPATSAGRPTDPARTDEKVKRTMCGNGTKTPTSNDMQPTTVVNALAHQVHSAIDQSLGDISVFTTLLGTLSSTTDIDTAVTTRATIQLQTSTTTREQLCAAQYAYARGYVTVGDYLASQMKRPPTTLVFDAPPAVAIRLAEPPDAFAYICIVDECHGDDADECELLCGVMGEAEHTLDEAIEAEVERVELETVQWTPVEYACHLGYVDIVTYLLKERTTGMPPKEKIELLRRARDRAAQVGTTT